MFARRISPLWLLVAVLAALVLSSARAADGSTAESRYVVKPGDTLWAIAADRYGGDPRRGVWRLRERNGLTSAGLTSGMILYLPP
jgi:hypothetical protein